MGRVISAMEEGLGEELQHRTRVFWKCQREPSTEPVRRILSVAEKRHHGVTLRLPRTSGHE